MVLGHEQGQVVLVARRGEKVLVVDATCTHYDGPLAEGVMVGDTIHETWRAFGPKSLWNKTSPAKREPPTRGDKR